MSKVERQLAHKVPPDQGSVARESFLTAPQVQVRYSVTSMTLHRWLKNPALNFPRPLYIAKRRYFREVDLIAWERARVGRTG